jgi:hypothetical protein
MEQNADDSTRQLAFEFAGNASDGLSLWREQQKAALRRLGIELGLPLGAQCEVLLESGLLLRGRLFLNENDLFPVARRDSAVLRIGDINFFIGEIASCVRID